jgi:hypothetical protein
MYHIAIDLGRQDETRPEREYIKRGGEQKELEAQGITRPCRAREIIITGAISKAEEIMRKIEKSYPPR